MLKFEQKKKEYSKGSEIVARETQMPTWQGRLAMEIAVKHAMIAAAPDGVDAAGRQKVRLMTPSELAQRACNIAHELSITMVECGMMLDVPELAPESALVLPPGLQKLRDRDMAPTVDQVVTLQRMEILPMDLENYPTTVAAIGWIIKDGKAQPPEK